MKRLMLLLFLPFAHTLIFAQENDINLVFIGNSITAGATLPNRNEQAPPTVCGRLVEEVTGRPTHVFNGGHSGITTYGFLPGRNDFERVCRAATSLQQEHGGLLIFSIMLGTNDSACSTTEGAPVAPDTYEANIRSIIDTLIQRFPACRIVLNYPIWYSPNTHNSARYLQEGLDRLHSYHPVVRRVAKQYPQVHAGEHATWKAFGGKTELFTPEKGNAGIFHLHPNPQGASLLAKFWAKSIVKAVK